MAYDDQLADRVREQLAATSRVTEQEMFGDLAFLVAGHMACGVVGRDLMVRLGRPAADEARERKHVREMDFTGRPMRTMVFVAPEGL